jgi:prophage tail gpP-like protein/phage tail protein X
LSITYNIGVNDTLDRISRRFYGSPTGAARIFSANPHVVWEDVGTGRYIGVEIVIPDINRTPIATNVGEDQLNLTIERTDGERVQFTRWSSVIISQSLDSIDTVELEVPFDPTDDVTRSYFKPLAFHRMGFAVGRQHLFNGTMIDILPRVNSESSVLTVSAYSEPGVLADCTVSSTQFTEGSLQFDNMRLDAIAQNLCEPFGISVIVDTDVGAPFEELGIRQDQRVFDFLTKLAKQRGVIMTNDASGALRIWRPQGESTIDPTIVDDQVVRASLNEGDPTVTSVTPSFKPQSYYSHITAVTQPWFELGTIFKLGGDQSTVVNERQPAPLRPHCYIIPESQNADSNQAARAKMGRMFANSVSYSVEVIGWRDSNGKLWQPNRLVKLYAPSAMVYEPYEFLVRGAVLRRSHDQETTVLDLVIPESYTGNIPKGLPWG